jgi:uncharacterized SAM-binding protein YcdF (DUF218 family)
MPFSMSSRTEPRSRSRRWPRRLLWSAAALGAGGMLSLVGLAIIIARYGTTDRARAADVIIVLGGGESGTTRRALHAVTLYRQGYAPAILCSGAYAAHETISEGARCAEVARREGVPAAAIVVDERSRSTEENAIESAAIMRARGWRSAVLVTDDFHLWRATWLFTEYGMPVWPSPAQRTTPPVDPGGKTWGLAREVLATGWHTVKSLLGLPQTSLEVL